MNQDLLIPTKVEIFNRQPTCGPPAHPFRPSSKTFCEFQRFFGGKMTSQV